MSRAPLTRVMVVAAAGVLLLDAILLIVAGLWSARPELVGGGVVAGVLALVVVLSWRRHLRRLSAIDTARQVVRKGLSVRDTEQLVRRVLANQAGKNAPPAGREANADIRRLEVDLSGKLGATVHIDHTKKGTGKLVIKYNSLDELDGILKHIK